MKPFQLDRALAGEAVVTRDGKPVTDIKIRNSGLAFPVLAKNPHFYYGKGTSYTIDGYWYGGGVLESKYDLFMM